MLRIAFCPPQEHLSILRLQRRDRVILRKNITGRHRARNQMSREQERQTKGVRTKLKFHYVSVLIRNIVCNQRGTST